jgi:hypothetical protein
VGCFIHLHPASGDGQPPAAEKAVVKHVFLLAKHLTRALTDAAQQGRSCFLTVTRLDGALGLGRSGPFGPVGGGLFGLTKTLALEWPGVFCRAVDISPDFTDEQSANAILAELHDPNRLVVETAWGELGRVTLRA